MNKLETMPGYYISGVFYKGTHEEARRRAGKLWAMSHVFTALADLASIDTLVVTGNREVMFHNSLSALGDFHMFMYEDPTITANGTSHTLINPNRYQQSPILATCFLNPTNTALGLEINHELIIGGTSGGGMGNDNRTGAAGERMFILKPNSFYLVRHTNISGAASSGTLFTVLDE